MKKLGKLVINSERIMKSEELLNLRGGEDEGEGTCGYYCWDPNHPEYDTLECDKSLGYVESMDREWEAYGWACRWCCDHCSETPYCGSSQ